MSEAGKVLECLLCEERFSIADVMAGNYYPSTGICKDCYQKGSETENSIWCFGTYSVQYLECRIYCKDRKICRVFTKNSEEILNGETRD